MAKAKRDSWSNKIGFVLAAAGAAVGLGNIWRFPYVCGENGGGAFILAYIGCVFLLGMPVVWAELMIGRSSGRGSGGAFAALTKKNKSFWKIVGVLGVIIAFLVTSYYTIIAGWTLEYLFQSVTGAIGSIDASTSESYFNEFMASDKRQVFWHLIFTVLTALIVFKGISGGIEKTTEVLMPVLLAILVGLAIFALNMEASMAHEAGIEPKSWSFLFKPDWSQFTAKSFFHALGQAFFSLSVAVGTMIAYGSYLDKKENIPQLGTIVVCMDTFVALLGGLVIFPIVFAFGLNPEAGTGLVFVTLPALFSQMPFGNVIAPLFYILLFFAAITSSVSLLEPVVTHFIDEMKKSRLWATAVSAMASFLAGVVWILVNSLENKTIFDNVDKLVSDLMIPVSAICICIFAGWVMDKKLIKDDLKGHAPEWIIDAWRYSCKFLAPIAMGIILIRGIFFGDAGH